MKKSRFIALFIALVMLVGIFAACAQPEEDTPTPPPVTPTPPVGNGDDDDDDDEVVTQPPVAQPGQTTTQDTVTVLTMSLAVGFVPYNTNDVPSSEMQRLIFDRLFMLDYDTGLPVPEISLAINWEQPDARTTHIEIRQGVYFHNGEPLTAHDVAFSLNQTATSAFTLPILGVIDRVVAHDDWNLTVYTEIDFVPIIAHLGHVRASIVPARLIEEIGEDEFNANPIGSGAWMFDHMVLGDRIELVANPNFWAGPPILSRVIYRVVPEASVRLMEVQAGTADVATHIAPIDIPMAEADPNVTVIRRLNFTVDYLGFNMERPHISDLRVRQAISYALDTVAIFNHVWLGTGGELHGPIAPMIWGYHSMEPREVNLDRARELLIEAGYNPTPGEPGGFDTTIWWNIPNAQREQAAEMVSFTLAGLNINAEIVSMEWAAYLDGTARGDHDMFILGWSTGTFDADNGIWPLFHSQSPSEAGNRTFTNSPELDALLDAGRSELDPAARMEIYRQIHEWYREYVPWVTLRQGEVTLVAVANLEGFTPSPGGIFNWTPVWFS